MYLGRDRKRETAKMTATIAIVTKLTASIANVEHKILMDNFFSFSELYDD
jgi:hypothetical protein